MDRTYNYFHQTGTVQTRVIVKKNFTYRKIIQILTQTIGTENSITILDYGCGVGTVDLYLAKLGNQVVGIDISPRALALASLSASKTGLGKLAKFFPINKWRHIKRGKKFDLAICLEVIEHVPDEKRVLTEIADSLKSGGKLILSTPSINAPLYKLGLAKEFDGRVGHLRRYRLTELIHKIASSGFKIKKVVKTEGIIRNSLFLFPGLGWIIRLLKGPISDIATLLDNMTVSLFGESNFIIVAEKT